MDAKITKKRLSRMLSYDWLKIVGLAVGLIIFWNLIFIVTATRVRPSQQFTVLNHKANYALSDDFYDDLSKAINDGTFSYEVMEMTKVAGQTDTFIETRLQTSEADVMFIPKLADPSSAYEENGETKYYKNYLQSILWKYGFYLADLDPEKEGGYFYNLKVYLNEYYEDYNDADSLDEEKVKSDFRARAKKNKDKRFKTEAQLADGAKKDVERIQKYRDALLKFEGFLERGLVAFEEVSVEGDGYALSGKFALNLCPNEDTMGALKKYVSYGEKGVDEEGEETIRITAKDMCVLFFDTDGTEQGFEYESLLYVVHVIEESVAS